jgi:hypothetical protein
MKEGVVPYSVEKQPTVPPVPVAGKPTELRAIEHDTRGVTGAAESLEERVRRLERAVRSLQETPGDLDRVMKVPEIAKAIGKSRCTLLKRLRDANEFERWQMALLVRKDPTGHWVSSPRLVARWRQVMFRNLQELAR